ncbi:hypothetical protein Tco_0735531 [Tanacetum coccineum]
MEEKAADFVTPIKISDSGEAQEEEISPTILEAAKTLSQVASKTVSTYKRRARSTKKGKDISIGLDTEIELNTNSTEVNTSSTPVSTPSIVQKVNVIVPSLVKEDGRHDKSEEEVLCRAKGKSKEEQANDTSITKRLYKYLHQESKFLENGSVEKLMKSIENFVPMKSKERVKRPGVQLEQETLKKQKTNVEDVPVTEKKVEELIKRTGKRKKQKARKGVQADKTAQHKAEEDMGALVKGNDRDSSLGTDIPVSAVPVAIKPPNIANWKIIKLEEAAKEELAIRISQRYALLEEERHVIETMAYNDQYKKILDGIWKDKVELDGMTVKEDEEAVKRIKGEALKEKEDHSAFIFPIRLEGKAEAMGKLSNVLCQVGVTTIIAKFIILDIPIDRDAPIVVGRGFLCTIGSLLNTSERIFSTFNGICHQIFRAARFDILRIAESDSDDKEEYTMGTNDDEAGSSRSKRSRHETVEEVLLPQVHHEFLLWEDVPEMLSLEIDDMLRIGVREAESEEEIFTLFDEVCAGDELQSKKIIKFRLGGRAHSFTLLEFAHRLGLYQAVELEEDGFNVYFKGGLHSDDNFNAVDYWLSISREDNLGLSRIHTSTIKRPILRVIHKMITYGLCQRTTGLDDCKMDEKERIWDSERESICCGKFISKIARKCKVLTEDVVRSLSSPIYCRDLDTTTFKDLIDYDGKLILEDPQLGVPRVSIPRPQRASMHDLYDRMGRMEI